jgi:hypothetical protein
MLLGTRVMGMRVPRSTGVRLLLGLCLMLAVAGAVLASRSGQTPATAASSTVVTFHRTGGFIGGDDLVKVYRDRRVTVRHRTGAAEHRRLSVTSMKRLRHDLAAAHLERGLPSSGPSGCADCYVFDIAAGGHRVHFSEDRTPARMRPLIDRLSRLAN